MVIAAMNILLDIVLNIVQKNAIILLLKSARSYEHCNDGFLSNCVRSERDPVELKN